MGEEYRERRPFPFFCSFSDAGLIDAVRRGRREEFEGMAFQWSEDVPDPFDPQTFAAAKLTWAWPEGSAEAKRRRLWRDLLTARRRWPALRNRRCTTASVLRVEPEGRVDHSEQSPVLVLGRGAHDHLLACANLSDEPVRRPELDLRDREVLLSTEDEAYGGPRTSADDQAVLHPYELIAFGPGEWRL